jgi:hypothetical protein
MVGVLWYIKDVVPFILVYLISYGTKLIVFYIISTGTASPGFNSKTSVELFGKYFEGKLRLGL